MKIGFRPFHHHQDFQWNTFNSKHPSRSQPGNSTDSTDPLDIRDKDSSSHHSSSHHSSSHRKHHPQKSGHQIFTRMDNFVNKLQRHFKKPNDPANIKDGQSSSGDPTKSTSNTPTSNTPTSGAHSVREAESKTRIQLKPVLRGDEAKLDAQVHDQASFGRLADQVAKEYGLDPNMFRAQLQAESAAFSNGYKQGMGHRGDLDRGANASVGLGQISGNFLNGGPWAMGIAGSPLLGRQTVSSQQYMSSVTTQLRMAAASDALRIHANGSVDAALRQYVSGHTSADPQNQIYIDNINRNMQNQEWMNIGR